MKSQMNAVALIAVFFCFFVFSSYAAVPQEISYQGRLLDNSGNPVEGITDITFALYDAPSGGTPLWSEVHEDLLITRGFVIVSLGSENPIYRTLIDKTFLPYFLGIQINDDPEIVPRQEIESVPYALLSSGVNGDIHTDTAKLIIDGQPGFPPELRINDHSSVTPTVDEYLRMTDLKVSLIVDRGAGDVDKTEIKADGLRIYDPTGVEAISFAPGAAVFNGVPVDFDGREAQWIGSAYPSEVIIDPAKIQLKSLTAPPIPSLDLPSAGEPFIALSDDVINQMFASLVAPGKLKVSEYLTSPSLELVKSCEIDANRIKFSTVDNVAEIKRVGDDILIYPPPIAGAGLDLGGIVTFSNPKLVSITTGSEVRYSIGSFSDYLGPTSRLRMDGGGATFEPSGGGAGGRIRISAPELVLTDDVPTATARLHRSDGLTVELATGHDAYYRADGVQLTGPGAARYGATHRGFSLTRPSNNGALICSLDDPSSLLLADMDDDGLSDFAIGVESTNPFVKIEPGTVFICYGAAEFSSSCDVSGSTTLNSCEMSGATQCHSTLTVAGTMTCRSGWYCDANNDATVDVKCESAPTPEFSIAPATRFACDGLATFDQSVQMNSNLTVNGALVVLGPKAFAQEHPNDPTKEVIYVALEGNEAGTYTRGSAQLKDGVAKIELREDFGLVTNEQGLTAQITPRGPVSSMLYVETVTPTTLVVKASHKQDGAVKFDFMVNGIRKGFENHQVIRDKKSVALLD